MKQMNLLPDITSDIVCPVEVLQRAVEYVENGADVNAMAKDGGTVLSFAAICADAEVVQKLIHLGADPNVGTTIKPILLAATCGNTDIARALIRAGANLTVTDSQGWSVLNLAELGNNEDLVALLQQYQAPCLPASYEVCQPV